MEPVFALRAFNINGASWVQEYFYLEATSQTSLDYLDNLANNQALVMPNELTFYDPRQFF